MPDTLPNLTMNNPEEPQRDRPAIFTPEAIVGTGITIASLGVMFLLLGWAQMMREVEAAAWILLPIGALMLVAGGLAAAFARPGKKS